MKIGIITFHESNNFGAALQAYALQKVINRYHKCEIINYCSEKISSDKKIEGLRKKKGIVGLLKRKLTLKYYLKKQKNFSQFLFKCNLSENKYSISNITASNEEYDCFITGSDQVFNLNITGNDRAYLLDFVDEKKKKVAYAVSLGQYRFNSADKTSVDLIKRIDFLSCREPEVSVHLKDICDREASVVLDPTLLLEQADWMDIEQEYKNIPDEYILAYFISPEKDYFSFALEAKKKLGIPVLYINYSAKKYYTNRMSNLLDVTPEQFLFLFHNAKFVVTNSFHGTVMATTFKKDFVVIKDLKREKANQRIDRILDLLNLKEAYVDDPKKMTFAHLQYGNDSKLKNERCNSFKFLEEAGVIDKYE